MTSIRAHNLNLQCEHDWGNLDHFLLLKRLGYFRIEYHAHTDNGEVEIIAASSSEFMFRLLLHVNVVGNQVEQY
jgi:hypothetical protein